MPSRVDVTIVTVSHNHWTELRDGLPRAIGPAERCVREAIVIDNACTDGTADHVRREFPGVQVIQNPRPLGFAANCNQGIALARGRHVLLLNPDVQGSPGSIDALVAFMDAHPDAGVAGPRLLNPDGSIQLTSRRFYTPLLLFLRGLGLERRLEHWAPQRDLLMQDWDHATVRDVDWVLGAALIARREAIDDVGPLDPAFFLYCEDQDWCHRMWTRGWRVYYVPESVMTHQHRRASSGSLFNRWKWIHVRSMLRMFRKQGVHGRRPAPSAPRVPHLESGR